MVKIECSKLEYSDVDYIVEEMMGPFFEEDYGCSGEFFEFVNTEDEDWKKFTSETIDVVRYPDGSLKHRYDECFWNKAYQSFSAPRYVYPEECEICSVILSDFYEDFEAFQKEWLQHEKNEETDEWGYWYNPQGYIDRYMMMGSDDIPVCEHPKPDKFVDPEEYSPYADGVRVGDIDFKEMDNKSDVEIKEWWDWYKGIEDGTLEDDQLFGVHYELRRMGIRTMSNKSEFDASRNEFPDNRDKWTEPKWIDKPLDFKTFSSTYRNYFRFSTYAVVEKDGTWHSAGRMGVFAEGDESVEEGCEWRQSFLDRFLLNEDEDTVVMVLDCHI